MPADDSASDVTEDAVLGGRLQLCQPRRGHRVGHDAILLAAACPARQGDSVIDFGAGVGGAGLAIAVRVPGTAVTLIEISPELAALAAENIRRNALTDRVMAVSLDVEASASTFAAAGLPPEKTDHVVMNPPFNDEDRQRSSPDPRRSLAHVASPTTLSGWVKTATRLLRPRGMLTLIWRADRLADVLAELAPGFGAVTILPVHPKPAEPAIRVLVRATKASRAPLALLPGIVLADESGQPTAGAEAVLRRGEALAFMRE